MTKRGQRLGDWLEGAGWLLEGALRLGLISGSAIAAALGQFMLALVLGALALGFFVRLWRGKVKR